MSDHDRHEFRRFIIATAAGIGLQQLLCTTREVLGLIDAKTEVDPRIEKDAATVSGRRQNGAYVVRYKDSKDYCNFFTDITIERLVRKRPVSTMNLLETLLRLNYYIVAHGCLPDDKLGYIVCTENVIDDQVVVVRLDDTPFHEPQLAALGKAKVVSQLSDLKGLRNLSQTPVKLHVYLRNYKNATFRWNEKPLQVLT